VSRIFPSNLLAACDRHHSPRQPQGRRRTGARLPVGVERGAYQGIERVKQLVLVVPAVDRLHLGSIEAIKRKAFLILDELYGFTIMNQPISGGRFNKKIESFGNFEVGLCSGHGANQEKTVNTWVPLTCMVLPPSYKNCLKFIYYFFT
jgi:hypothetical protein